MIEFREIFSDKLETFSDIAELYEFEGWGTKNDAQSIKRAVKNSYCAYGAFDGDKIVGFFRALCDGVGDAYLIDLIVHPNYRHQGIADKLVETITNRLKAEGIEWITCISTPNAKAVYQKRGSQMEGFIPFRFM